MSSTGNPAPWWRRGPVWAAGATVLALIFAGVSMASDVGWLASPVPDEATARPKPLPAGSTQSSSSAPAARYVVLHPLATLSVPRPGAFCASTDIDLDEFVVTAAGNYQPGTDLAYGCGSSNFGKADAERFGRASATEPDPESCVRAAGAEALSAIDMTEARPEKDAFCVVTDEGRIAWLLLTKRVNMPGSYDDLTFSAKVWELNS